MEVIDVERETVERAEADESAVVCEWSAIAFGVAVKRRRESIGVSVRAMAEALGCRGTNTVWRLECGLRTSPPGPKAMARIAAVLGVSVRELVELAGYNLGTE